METPTFTPGIESSAGINPEILAMDPRMYNLGLAGLAHSAIVIGAVLGIGYLIYRGLRS